MPRSDDDRAARLLERIVTDPEFRARYRRDPAAAAREMGVADDRDVDVPLETLEIRESRSSLAGAMAAVAVEGMGFFELVSGHPGPLGPAEAYASARPPVDHPGTPAPAAEPDPPPVEPNAATVPDVETDSEEPDEPEGDESNAGESESEGDESGTGESDGGESDTGESDESDGGEDDSDEDDSDEEEDEDEDEPDEEEPDEDEPDEDEPDEEEPDEEEPDEEEPDEDEPDEVGADADDLGDDEVAGAGDDDEGGEDDSDDADDSDSDGAEDDSPDGDDSDDDSDSDDADDSDDDGAAGTDSLDDVSGAYPGDDAPRAQTAAWMAAEAKRRGLPPELPVMAALVESGMRNLPGGDADSVGFFQMRVSIWNSGEYAGYGQAPRLQVKWFLDHAEAVKRDRLARGLPLDAKSYGEWIADVERPAAQYRGRYQLRLEEARELLRARDVHPHTASDLVDAASDQARAGPRAQAALTVARRFLGTPYQWGGASPKTGFDCSGLVQWAYAKAGISIPRVTDQQILAHGATKVARRDLLPGDLVFFRDPTGYVHHVGISLGGDRFVHAPHTGDVVKVSSLDEPYYSAQFTGGRRFDPPVEADAKARAMPVIRPDQVVAARGR